MAKKGIKSRLNNPARLNTMRRTMKAIVLARLAEKELTVYRLAQLVKGKMSVQAVYDYMNGKEDMKGERLLHLFDALGLEVTAKE